MSVPYLKSEGPMYLFQVTELVGLRKARTITALKYTFQKAITDDNEDSQALVQAAQRGCALSILAGFENPMG